MKCFSRVFLFLVLFPLFFLSGCLEKQEVVYNNLENVEKVYYADFDVKIDGNLSEWKNIPSIHIGTEDWLLGGVSAEIYLVWDEDNIYLAAAVSDKGHFNTREGDAIWNGDSLQFAFDAPLSEVHPFSLGVALASNKVQSSQWMGPDTKLFEKSEYTVVRDDKNNKTFYEIKIPFECLKMKAEKRMVFVFNAVVFEDPDGTGQKYWVEITSGIAGGWNPDAFKRFVLWNDK